MGTILFMLVVDIPTPTLMDATFESVNTFLPELNGSLCFRQIPSLYKAAGQLQASKHAT